MDVLFLRIGDLAEIPYDENTYWNVMQLCHRYTCEKMFLKTNLRIQQLESGEQIVVLYMSYDLIGLLQQGLEHLLNAYLHGLGGILIQFENALQSGEIKGYGMSSDDALKELKKEKDKLDLGLITEEEFNKRKEELMKYIK